MPDPKRDDTLRDIMYDEARADRRFERMRVTAEANEPLELETEDDDADSG